MPLKGKTFILPAEFLIQIESIYQMQIKENLKHLDGMIYEVAVV